jgi:hypothetical protein
MTEGGRELISYSECMLNFRHRSAAMTVSKVMTACANALLRVPRAIMKTVMKLALVQLARA